MALLEQTDEGAILLTGGTGYLGSRLLAKLLDGRKKKLILLKRSTSSLERIRELLGRITAYDIDREPLERAFKEHAVDCIIHCAAEQGKKYQDPNILVDANVRFPLKLLQMGSEHNVACFINADTILDKNVNAYALSKHQFREWLQLYSAKMTCLNVAMELFYGPGDRQDKFVTFVVRELLQNVEAIDLTRGEQRRDFVYIDDVVSAFLKIVDHSSSLDKGYRQYAVGTGQAMTIRDIVTLIKTLSGNTRTILNFGAKPYRENEVMDSRVDSSELRKIGWQPAYSLREGLQATIHAERNNLTSF